LKISKAKLLDMYIKMLHIRKFEEKVAYFFSIGKVHGTTHLYIGEEATAVGACAALKENDLITSTHRGHGHCIAKGIDLNRMMAEFLGKEEGYCKGKGGSMHIADLSRGNLGANGVVGGGIPIAVGAGLTIKMKELDKVVLCFFGDGAMNQGSFHESVNLASIWDLPVVFICENNQYGMSMHVKRHIKVSDLTARATAYGIPGVTVNGNDILEVYESVLNARDYVKQSGPMLIVANTYRFMGHSKSDANAYRTKEEIESWKQKCPLMTLRKYLIDRKMFSAKKLNAVEKSAQVDIENAVTFADQCSFPSIETIQDDVYA
jgi:acetoin:2,6-dichlorophenolindophenol oxidoreductase subunit alpha